MSTSSNVSTLIKTKKNDTFQPFEDKHFHIYKDKKYFKRQILKKKKVKIFFIFNKYFLV